MAIANKCNISFGESRASYRRLDSEIAAAEPFEISITLLASRKTIRHIRCSLLDQHYYRFFLLYHESVMLIFPREYKRDLEHFANYALEICSPRARGCSMNANHRDIMEQYYRPRITSDKFSPNESVVLQKLRAHVGNNNRGATRSREFEGIFEIDARARAGPSNNSQADR